MFSCNEKAKKSEYIDVSIYINLYMRDRRTGGQAC